MFLPITYLASVIQVICEACIKYISLTPSIKIFLFLHLLTQVSHIQVPQSENAGKKLHQCLKSTCTIV